MFIFLVYILDGFSYFVTDSEYTVNSETVPSVPTVPSVCYDGLLMVYIVTYKHSSPLALKINSSDAYGSYH